MRKFLNIIQMFATLVILLMIINVVPSAATLNEPQCCMGKNLLTTKCVHNNTETSILLHCDNGRYMMDPTLDESENYTINKDGDLVVLETNFIVSQNEYCTANYMPEGANESRKVVLVCFTGDYDQVLALFVVKGTLAFISVLFIAATLYVYWIIPELRETQDKVTCCALCCLMIFLFFLGIVQVVMPDKLSAVCIEFAFIIYFFTIAYFTWLNLIMLNVWKTSVLPKWKIKEKKWYILNHIYGWAIPVSLTLALYISPTENGLSHGFGERSCWFANVLETWVFLYFPISIMLVINVILFTWSIYGLHRHGNDVSPDARNAMAYKCKLYLKLFILAGLNWTLEVLSFHFGSQFLLSWFWVIIDICNALFGVLIFFVLIVYRRRVRAELAGKSILCFKCPQSWANARYTEAEHLNSEEDNIKYDFTVKN